MLNNLCSIYLWELFVTLKIYIVFRYIFGFKSSGKIPGYVAFIYPVLIIPLLSLTGIAPESVLKFIWFFIFSGLFFEGDTGIKFSLSMLSVSMISVAGLAVSNVLLFVMSEGWGKVWIENILSTFLLAVLAMLARKQRQYIHDAVNQKGSMIKIAIFVISLIAFFWVGIMWLLILENPDNRLLLYAEFFSIVLAAVCIFIVVINLYQRVRISRMQERDGYTQRILELGQKYLDSVTDSENELRSFRHDFNNHLILIGSLADEGQNKKIVDYIAGLKGKYEFTNYVNTGNRIVDIFVNKLIQEFKNESDFEYNCVGRFDNSMKIDDVDMAIMASNLIDNALEALKKVSGKKVFEMEVSHYNDLIFWDIANSADEGDKDLTTHKNTPGHGLGVGKIRSIAEGCGGSAFWKYENGMMRVHIELTSGE